ncbi:MAG: NADPH-dependent F420 reductase [Gemmatimonadales bacterium]
MPTFGVLGSGEVGQILAKGLKDHGYQVRIGSRTPAKLADYSKQTGIQAGTFAEVARWGEAIVLSVAGGAAEPVLGMVGRDALRGKLVIDTTNPIADQPPEQGVLKSTTGPNTSLMEQLQRAYPEARFVKCFSCVGSARMVDPDFHGTRPTMFYCGDDPGAKATVARILDQFGWEAEDMGGAIAARAIEPLAVLWCIPGFLRDSWAHAFHLLR